MAPEERSSNGIAGAECVPYVDAVEGVAPKDFTPERHLGGPLAVTLHVPAALDTIRTSWPAARSAAPSSCT